MKPKLITFTFDDALAMFPNPPVIDDAFYANALLHEEDFFTRVCKCCIDYDMADLINELIRCNVPMVCFILDAQVSTVLNPAQHFLIQYYGAKMLPILCSSDDVIRALDICCPKYAVQPNDVAFISNNKCLVKCASRHGYMSIHKQDKVAVKTMVETFSAINYLL